MISNRNMIPKPTFGYQKLPLSSTSTPSSNTATGSNIPPFTAVASSQTSQQTIRTHSNQLTQVNQHDLQPPLQTQTHQKQANSNSNSSLLNKLSFQFKLAKFQNHQQQTQISLPPPPPLVSLHSQDNNSNHSNGNKPSSGEITGPSKPPSHPANSTVSTNPANSASSNSQGFTLTLNQSSAVLAAAAAAAAASAATNSSDQSKKSKLKPPSSIARYTPQGSTVVSSTIQQSIDTQSIPPGVQQKSADLRRADSLKKAIPAPIGAAQLLLDPHPPSTAYYSLPVETTSSGFNPSIVNSNSNKYRGVITNVKPSVLPPTTNSSSSSTSNRCYTSLIEDSLSSKKPIIYENEVCAPVNHNSMPTSATIGTTTTSATSHNGASVTHRVKPTPAVSVTQTSNIKRLTAHFSNSSLKPVVPSATSTTNTTTSNRSAIPSFNTANPATHSTTSYRHSIHTSSLSKPSESTQNQAVKLISECPTSRGSSTSTSNSSLATTTNTQQQSTTNNTRTAHHANINQTQLSNRSNGSSSPSVLKKATLPVGPSLAVNTHDFSSSSSNSQLTSNSSANITSSSNHSSHKRPQSFAAVGTRQPIIVTSIDLAETTTAVASKPGIVSLSRRVSKEDSGIDRRAGEQEAGVTGAVVVEEKEKNEVEEDFEPIKKMNETFEIEDELETCPDSPTSHSNTDAINPTTATTVQPASSSPKRKRPSISGDINNNDSSNRAKVSLFDSSGIAKNGEDELEFLENELIPDDLMAGGDEAIVDTSSSLNAQQNRHNHSQTSENQIISSPLAFPLNDYEMSEEVAIQPQAETSIEVHGVSISNEVQTVVDDLIEKLCATTTTTTIIKTSTTREEPSAKPLAHMQSIKALQNSDIKNDDDYNSKHMSLTTTTTMMTTASDNSVNDKNTPQTTLLLSPASTHQQQESTPTTATTMIIMNEDKPQSKTESSPTTVSNNSKRPQPLPRRIIRSTPLEDTGALEDTTKLIQLNVCAPSTVPQPSKPAVDRALTSVTLSALSSDEVVLVTETVEQTQTVMKKTSPAPTSTATKNTVAKTAVSPPTSRPRTVQTITQRTAAPPPPPQLKKPSVDVASNSTTSNGIVNKSSTQTTATKKVTSSTSSTSSVQKSLVKKLKSMQPPTGLTDSANNKDEDLNSVFETDNQTTCSSDNEISSSKSSSRTNSIKLSAQTSQVPTVKKSSQMSSSSNSNIGLAPQLAKDANAIFASATVKKPTIQQRKLTQSVTKQNKGNNNNKENQDQSPISIPKGLTSLGKIYRSRDGLAAVSSNTSIMSELSNISKSSLPSSMPVATSNNNNNTNSNNNNVTTTNANNNSSNSIQQQPSRHGSISSSSGIKASGHHQQVFQVPPPPPVLRQSTLSQQTIVQTSSAQKPATNVNTVAGMTHRIQSNSSKFLTQLSQHNSQQQQQQQQQAPSTSIRRGSQQQLQQSSATTNIFKKPGQPPSSSLSSSHVVVKSTNSSNVEPASVAALLSISTGANATAGIVASLPSSSTSPSSSSAASSRTTAAMSSSSNSNEAKLGREIKRLEALCESRTKELSMLKLKLKETLCSFDAIAVAFDYLANKLNGFEAKGLRSKLEFERKKTSEQMERLEAKIVEKEKCLNEAHEKLNDLTRESTATRETLEKKLEEQAREFETRLSLLNAEHELILKDVRLGKETAVSRLSKQMDVQKMESERTVSELREALSRKESENVELEARVKECEDALGKDKDERNQRLIEIQKNLEKEIESLKAAIDIKNIDLVQLRTKNNELMTKVENYNELSIKLRRSKQEIEQLNAIIKIKQEAERRASEHNRVLVMKIEAKNKENQRLSMQNEQLQFRLQSHPNLSANNDSLLTTSNFDTTLNTPNKLDSAQCSSSMAKPRTKTMIETTTTPNNVPSGTDELPQTTSNSLPVKLRSKSFKTTSSTCQNNSLFAEQFRPVSENFDFDDENPSSHAGAGGVSSRDFLMTRSVIVCDSTSSSSSSHRGVGEDDELMVDGNNMESSSCSSNSHMDQNNQSPVSSESCMKSIDEPTINYGVRSPVAILDETSSPSNVEAPASPAAAEPSVNSPELMSTSIASIIMD